MPLYPWIPGTFEKKCPISKWIITQGDSHTKKHKTLSIVSTHKMGEMLNAWRKISVWQVTLLTELNGNPSQCQFVTPEPPTRYRLTAAVMLHILENHSTAYTSEIQKHIIIIFSPRPADSAMTLRWTMSAYQNKGQNTETHPPFPGSSPSHFIPNLSSSPSHPSPIHPLPLTSRPHSAKEFLSSSSTHLQ